MKQMIQFVLCLVVLSIGCQDIEENRNYINQSATSAQLDDNLSVRIWGASILYKERAQDNGFAIVRLRAQSFDVRVDLTDGGCQENGVWFELSHLPGSGLVASYRAFLDGLSAAVEASRSVFSGGLGLIGDAHDLVSTPLGSEDIIATGDSSAGVQNLKWTACTRRGTNSVKVVEGWISPSDCWADMSPISSAVCVDRAEEHTEAIGAAALRIRHRFSRPLAGAFSFATWGNNAGNTEIRQAIIDAVNLRDDLSFAVISGDLTAEGFSNELSAAVTLLDENLDLPWYATLGDRDVSGPVATSYILYTGISSFAFDVGPLRILVPDSADRFFGLETRNQLSEWLSGSHLGWPGDPSPPASMVITHVPPFEEDGLRGIGFRSRKEAAAAIALLRRGESSYVVTSQLATYRRAAVAGVPILHAGGAGAAIEKGSGVGHHWLLVRVDPECANADRPETCGSISTTEPCPCITIEPQFLD